MSLKKDILRILEENRGTAVSGQELGRQLQVSRSAAWKAIQSLREEGHEIIAVTNKGYQLSQESDLISEEGLRLFLKSPWKQIPLKIHKILDSTNEEAKRMAVRGMDAPAVVFADQQSHGKGRYGKTFFSPPQSGIYMTLLLRPEGDIESSLPLTFAAAVAVCRAIERLTDLKPQIKWVNDVYLGRKKFCGILTEAVSDFESGAVESVLVGIGVNVKTAASDFPLDLQNIAGSLDVVSLSRNHLAAEILNELLDLYTQLQLPGNCSVQNTTYKQARSRLLQAYKDRSLVLGKEISFLRSGQTCTALVMDINEKGNLVVKEKNGAITVLRGGEISIVKESLWSSAEKEES